MKHYLLFPLAGRRKSFYEDARPVMAIPTRKDMTAAGANNRQKKPERLSILLCSAFISFFGKVCRFCR